MKNTWNFALLGNELEASKPDFPAELVGLLTCPSVYNLLKSPFFQSLHLVDGEKHYHIYKNRFYAIKEFTLRTS